MTDIAATTFAALDAAGVGGPIGVAVSGGGDSVALMRLAHDWAAARKIPLHVATVDHGLRSESAAEAAAVARRAQSFADSVEILPWRGWDERGNLQAAARDARRALLGDWAGRRGLAAVALGHTMDDQAETMLMRLGRGAGVDGLSGMALRSEALGVTWLRPLLSVRREALRAWLRARDESWIDDPSNEDPRFDRVRARNALAALADLGVGVEGLARSAHYFGEARAALDHAAADLAARAARWGECGELRLALAPLRAAPAELTRRLLRAGLKRVAGAKHGPRGEAERRLLTSLLESRPGAGRSLHGCLIRADGEDHVVLTREPAGIASACAETGGLWDGRFEIALKPECEGGRVAALGEAGVRHVERLTTNGRLSPPSAWRTAPVAARAATPGLWREGALAAAPLAGFGGAMSARFAAPGPDWASDA